MENFNNIPFVTLLTHGSIAIFGGLVHALDRHRQGKTKNIFDVLILTIISSFSGIVFALLALYMFENQYLTLAIAGSGGYLGIEGLSMVAKRLQDMLTKK